MCVCVLCIEISWGALERKCCIAPDEQVGTLHGSLEQVNVWFVDEKGGKGESIYDVNAGGADIFNSLGAVGYMIRAHDQLHVMYL